jgi:hypothetical protein
MDRRLFAAVAWIGLSAMTGTCSTSSVAPPVKTDSSVTDSVSFDRVSLDGLTDEQLCEQGCATTATVACPDQATCMSKCVDGLAMGLCVEETRATLACLINSGAGSVICDPLQHLTIFRPGFCTDEQAATNACVRDASTGGG